MLNQILRLRPTVIIFVELVYLRHVAELIQDEVYISRKA
mgnify:CR=1 FL=1